jgi:hypothetical protein
MQVISATIGVQGLFGFSKAIRKWFYLSNSPVIVVFQDGIGRPMTIGSVSVQ